MYIDTHGMPYQLQEVMQQHMHIQFMRIHQTLDLLNEITIVGSLYQLVLSMNNMQMEVVLHKENNSYVCTSVMNDIYGMPCQPMQYKSLHLL